MLELKISYLTASVVIFFFTLITHGLVIFNDGVYWDGWLTNSWQRSRDWNSMYRFYSQVGMPLLYYQHRIMAGLPFRTIIYKLLAFLSIYISSVCVYILGFQFGFLSGFEALILALLMLCFPGQEISAEPVISMQYAMPVALFFIASLFGMQAERLVGWEHYFFRLASIILFLICFNMNSLLLYYFGYILLIGFVYFQANKPVISEASNFVIKHIDFLVLPILFWTIKEKYTPRWGIHENYNRINLNPFSYSFRLSYRRLVAEGIIGQIVESLKCYKSRCGKLALAILLILLTFYQLFYGGTDLDITNNTSTWNAVLLLGVVMLVLGTLPYALVGQVFGLQGWETKNNLLLPLPLALIIMSLVNIFVMPSLRLWILAIVISAFILRCNYNYLLLQAVWAKHESFLQKLSRMNDARKMSILGVMDLHSVKISLRENPEHPANTLYFMFERIWGNKSHLGIQVENLSQVPFSLYRIEKAIKDSCLDWVIKDVDNKGEQGLITIKDGESRHPVYLLALKYLYYRMCKPALVENYLDGITKIDFYSFSLPSVSGEKDTRPAFLLPEQAEILNNHREVRFSLSILQEALIGIFNAIGTCLIKLKFTGKTAPYFQHFSGKLLDIYLRLVRFIVGPEILSYVFMAYPNDYPRDIVEDTIDDYLEVVPYSSSATKLLFDYIENKPDSHVSSVPDSANKRLLIYDSIFPNLQCSFTTAEFNAYLERFPNACVYTSGANFSGFDGPITFDAVLADYAKEYPHLANRVYKVRTDLDYSADLFYTLFLSNMFSMINLVESLKMPFVFTLYSGGEFCMDDPVSDAKAQRVFSSPYFRKVIIGQGPIREYILSKNMVQPEQIEFIYGPICSTDYLLGNAVPKKYYSRDKSTFDICFVAYKHMPLGRDKGYDIFIQVAKLLLRLSPDFHFHVVGGFTPADIDVSDLAGHIHFYGKQPFSFFPAFHSSMDIVLSPCLPFVLAPGAFDGAPNVSTIEAGLCGVAVFMTDQLKQNKIFENNKDVVVVPHDAWVISEMIEHYFRNIEAFYRIAHQGREKFAEVFNRQVQIEPRIRLLESFLRE